MTDIQVAHAPDHHQYQATVDGERGGFALPLRPFIKGWIGRQREYVALVHAVPESTAKD